MSRWADLFAELSGARDNGDIGDNGNNSGPTVTKVTIVTPPPAQKSDASAEPTVTIVTTVNAPLTKTECGENGADISANVTNGFISGRTINNVRDHDPRAASLMTMGTLVTMAAEWVAGISCLNAAPPPGGVSLARWRQFLADAQRLLDDGSIAQAAASGWTAYDLFGCDDMKPFDRLDQWGLVWFLKGGRVVGMSMSTAVIEMGRRRKADL